MNASRRANTLPWSMLALGLLGVVSVSVVEVVWGGSGESQERAIAASVQMQEVMRIIAAYRAENGPPLDPSADINATGLIGTQFSPMTTSVGSLEAKRTATNPNTAGLMVHLLDESGVREGDFVAVGASGSFPGLILATLCAAEAMSVDVGLIVSLGASQWGANLLDFTWLDIEDLLRSAGALPLSSVAATVGGDLDIGRDLDSGTQEFLRSRIEASGAILIDDPDLASNVASRMAIYGALAGDRRIGAFINIGGAWANLGTDAAVLGLPPGLNRIVHLPPPETRGVVYAMGDLGVPIIHLLNIKELAQRLGLPWDPSPLPGPGALRVHEGERGRIGVIAVGSTYLAAVVAWLVRTRVRRRPAARGVS